MKRTSEAIGPEAGKVGPAEKRIDAEQQHIIQKKVQELVETKVRESTAVILDRYDALLKEELELKRENAVLKNLVDMLATALGHVGDDVERCRREFEEERKKAF